jgi:hypothetical protein
MLQFIGIAKYTYKSLNNDAILLPSLLVEIKYPVYGIKSVLFQGVGNRMFIAEPFTFKANCLSNNT